MKEPMPTTYSEIADVREWLKMMGWRVPTEPGHGTKARLRDRLRLLQEEVNELKRAVEEQDLVGQADGVVDVTWVALSIAVLLGLPWYETWNEVARSNWAKDPGATARSARDAVKPSGWKKPDLAGVLERAGYRRTAWTIDETDEVEEGRCREF